jgi:hypothetical protein
VALADALKVNKSVTKINLEDNEIGAEGAAALTDALKVNKSVTSINISCNRIGAEGASESIRAEFGVVVAEHCRRYRFVDVNTSTSTRRTTRVVRRRRIFRIRIRTYVQHAYIAS